MIAYNTFQSSSGLQQKEAQRLLDTNSSRRPGMIWDGPQVITEMFGQRRCCPRQKKKLQRFPNKPQWKVEIHGNSMKYANRKVLDGFS